MGDTTSSFETSTDIVDEISTISSFKTLATDIATLDSTTTTTSAPYFTWIIQTITPPPAVIISTDYGYYYLYSFYCCLSLLFLISMILLSVKLSAMRAHKNANARSCAVASTVTYNGNANAVNNAVVVIPSQPFDDLPPKYDDLGIVNSSMDMTNLDMV